jgi:hypothetical protein
MTDKDRSRLLKNHFGFLRMTAIELRRLGDRNAELAVYLRNIADQLEAEIRDVADRLDPQPRGFV